MNKYEIEELVENYGTEAQKKHYKKNGKFKSKKVREAFEKRLLLFFEKVEYQSGQGRGNKGFFLLGSKRDNQIADVKSKTKIPYQKEMDFIITKSLYDELNKGYVAGWQSKTKLAKRFRFINGDFSDYKIEFKKQNEDIGFMEWLTEHKGMEEELKEKLCVFFDAHLINLLNQIVTSATRISKYGFAEVKSSRFAFLVFKNKKGEQKVFDNLNENLMETLETFLREANVKFPSKSKSKSKSNKIFSSVKAKENFIAKSEVVLSSYFQEDVYAENICTLYSFVPNKTKEDVFQHIKFLGFNENDNIEIHSKRKEYLLSIFRQKEDESIDQSVFFEMYDCYHHKALEKKIDQFEIRAA